MLSPSARKGDNLKALGIVLAVAAIALLLMAGRAQASDFCSTPSANAYLRPLSRLPALRSVPSDGALPFAPSVYLKIVNGRLVGQGERIGLTIPFRRSSQTLPWEDSVKVIGTVSLLTRHGDVRRVLRRVVGVVGSGKPIRITVPTFVFGAIYRADVSFERSDGAHLGKYGEYFRAAAPKFAAQIGLSGERFHPGETVTARVENTGVERFGVGYGYIIERLNGSSWEADPTLQDPRRYVPEVLKILGPGATFDCVQISIPVDQSPGEYRVVKDVSGHHAAATRSFAVEAP